MLRRLFLRAPNGLRANWILVLVGCYNLYRGVATDAGFLLLGLGLAALGGAELLPAGRVTAAAALRGGGLAALLLFLPLLLACGLG